MTNGRNANWVIGGGIVAALLVLAALYFFVFIADDLKQPDRETTKIAGPETVTAAVRLYAITEANIRDQPTTKGSDIIGKLPRGSAISGILKVGNDGSEWLELSEGKGFVATANLVDLEPPEIIQSLGERTWLTDSRIDVYAYGTDNELIDSVSPGTSLVLVGLTDNDVLEVILRGGRRGYIMNGKAIIARLGGKPVGIAFNPQTCNFGPELSAEFDKLSARARARWEAADSQEYPDEAARERALGSIENRSSYAKLARSYEGLSLTALGLHFESQSLYFADPPAKVIETFRRKGFRIDANGIFPSTELYAGITATRGESNGYGKTELGCGV